MKLYLKNTLQFGLLLLAITLFFTNCEEERSLYIETEGKAYTIVHKDFDFVLQNEQLLSKVNSVSKDINIQSKGIGLISNDFKIFMDRVTYVVPTDKSREKRTRFTLKVTEKE